MPRRVPLVEKEVTIKSDKTGRDIQAKNVPTGDVNYDAAQAALAQAGGDSEEEPKKGDASGEADKVSAKIAKLKAEYEPGPAVTTRPATEKDQAKQPGVGGGNKDKLTGPESKSDSLGGNPKYERGIIKAIEAAKDSDFDVCKVVVPNTNLFCKKSFKIPRNDMPQLKSTMDPNGQMKSAVEHFKTSEKPITVNVGDVKLTINKGDISEKNGEINAEKLFAKHLKETFKKDISEPKLAKVTDLKASQGQLKGSKIAMFANALAGRYDGKREDGSVVKPEETKDADGNDNPLSPNPPYGPNTNHQMKGWVDDLKAPIVVSKDGYILDGHHRWAAFVQHDLKNGGGGDVEMQVKTVPMGAVDLVDQTKKFTDALGIETKSAGDARQEAEDDKKKNESTLRLTDLVNEILSKKL